MAPRHRISVGVSMQPDLIDQIDEEADERGRSALIRAAVREHLGIRDAENDE